MTGDPPPAAPPVFVDRRRPQWGVVASFDAARGLGTLRDERGRTLGFQATGIADGSRQIEVGTEVAFVTAAGHLGKVEARGLTPRAWATPSPGEVAARS